MASILVVDDVKFISRILAELLARRGHHVRTAADGIEAVETALADPPDLILLDITLPRMNGLDVARTLKTDPTTSGVPIMMITSRRDETAVRAAIEAGVEDFLTKPFDDAELLKRVAVLLGKSSTEDSWAPDVGAPENETHEIGTPEAGTPEVGALADGVSIVAPPSSESKAAWAAELHRALEEPEPGLFQSVVVDLSHLEGIGPEMADVIVAVQEAAGLAEEGRNVTSRLDVVRPGGGDLRTRLAVARIARAVAVHDDREARI